MANRGEALSVSTEKAVKYMKMQLKPLTDWSLCWAESGPQPDDSYLH